MMTFGRQSLHMGFTPASCYVRFTLQGAVVACAVDHSRPIALSITMQAACRKMAEAFSLRVVRSGFRTAMSENTCEAHLVDMHGPAGLLHIAVRDVCVPRP